MRSFRSMLRRFRQDEGGSLLAELVLVLPALLWSFLALFVFWDAFRSMNTTQKASYTISDTISREMLTFSTGYLDGLHSVMDFLLDADQDVKMRVTSITYSEDDQEYQVLWSYSPNGDLPELTTETLVVFEDRIPIMADADFATIVETEVPYVPTFNVGMPDQVLRQFIVTRPRYVAPNCLQGRICTPV